MLIRGLGPALAAEPFNLPDTLSAPSVAVFRGTQQIAENHQWDGSLATISRLVGAFALPPGSRDAALLLRLQPGSYSAVLSGVGTASGEALIEIYDVP